MNPMIAAFLTICAIISILYFIVVIFWSLREILRDSPAADDANDHNMLEMQPMLIPNGSAQRAGQIE